jgi:hypothetical protein
VRCPVVELGLLLAASLAATAVGGCVGHRGPGWERSDPNAVPPVAEPRGGVSLVLLGDAGASTKAAETTADELARVLAAEPRDRATVILWLGNTVHSGDRRAPCPTAGAEPRSPTLVRAVEDHRAAGGASFGVAGPVEWACGLGPASRPDPLFERPAPQYVVAIDGQGEATVSVRCDAQGCEADELPAPAQLELVMVDPTPWIERAGGGEPALRALDHLLSTLRRGGTGGTGEASDADRPPRILVSHFPVEAAGVHGTGGYIGDATIHTLYPALRDAVLAGAFDGVLAAHDHATYADADLTGAFMRADKVWAEAPLWQVVAGAASMPIAASARAAPKTRYYTSMAYVPETYSPHPGFAVVRIDDQDVAATLHAKRRRWQTATVSMPLRRPPTGSEADLPSMAPCVRCPAIPASER